MKEFIKKSRSGTFALGITGLIISNKEVKDNMKIVMSLEDSDLLIKTIKTILKQ